MCFSCRPKKIYHQLLNRMTDQPVRFDQNQIQQLRKKFQKIAGYKAEIDKVSFKKNMGILGLKSAHQFSDRLFNSFDIDNDGKISFLDFLQYMEVLKAGSDKHKARLSFKLIDFKNKNKFNINDFKSFLDDFFRSWSSITNISMTLQIKQRTDQYVKMIFNKVKKDRNTDEIDFKYYAQKLYKDKQFTEAFQFITQGVANIFISDKIQSDTKDHARILFRILKELKNLRQTVFQMSNQNAFQFEDILNQGNICSIPFAPGYLANVSKRKLEQSPKSGYQQTYNQQKSNKSPTIGNFNFSNCGYQYSKETQYSFTSKINTQYRKQKPSQYEQERSQTNNFSSVRSNKSKSASRKQIMNQKKLSYIETSLKKLLDDTNDTYLYLEEKFQRAQQQLIKKKQKQTVLNVHKKISKNSSEGTMVFFGDDNWNMVLNMMIGIQMAVRSVRGYQQMIYQEPKDFQLKYYFQLVPRRFGGQQYQSTIYSFTDYAPNTFNHIRKIFNIDNQDYISSIGPNRLMASLVLGQMSSMTSLTSQGKSGSFFYYTADGKYMLKTIKYREYKFLRSILKDYYEYIKTNPKTLITKFYGLHKLLQKDQHGDIIGRSYFIIMANVFNTHQKIVERYDLKGSWYGRQTTDNDPNATKKDLDFLKRQPIYLNITQRDDLLSIIKKDAQFFRQHQIIDYSLLIGVIKNSNSQLRNSNGSLIRNSEQNFLRETIIYGQQQCQEKYIFGIIDILTLYDSKKIMQYYFKRVFYGQGISAVPPDDYSERFINFIQEKVFKVMQSPKKINVFNSSSKKK